MSLQHLLLILRGRWKVVALTSFLAVMGALAVNLVLPKQYRATATVVVDVKGADPVAGGAGQTQVVPGYLATQVGIVASDRVVQRVIDVLKLDRDPQVAARWRKETHGQGALREWLALRLTKRLDVRPARDGNLIDISVAWEDPVRAEQIANAFAQAYIDTNLELKVEPAKQYANWFEQRNQALRKNLEAAQQRLSEYQRAHGIVASTDARLDVENTRLNELSSQLTVLQGLSAESSSRQREAARGQDSMPEVLQNPVIVGLKSDLSKLESRRADLAGRLGENHPELQRLESEIAGLRQRITQETNRVATSLNATNQINSARESEIRAALNAQRQRVLELSKQRDEIAVLQSDVANAQRAYDTVTQRLAQTSLESQNQTTNVMIITPAVAPLGPDSPRTKVNLVLSLVFGSLFGVALALLVERLDQRVHGADHLRTVLGAPVFGTLLETPQISVRNARRLAAARMPAIPAT